MSESNSQVLLQPAFILQHRKYRESSLILDVLTRDYGIVSILARGVRKSKSKTAGVLLAFTSLKISYIDRRELKILTNVELANLTIKLEKTPLYCGFYINELVSYFLHKNDPHPEVYVEYQQCLVLLANTQDTEQILRFFELNLIELIGYGLDLSINAKDESTVKALNKYSFDGNVGMVESITGYISGETLLSLMARNHLNKYALYEAKQLMRRIINFHLQGKVLKSRAVLAKIIKQL
jgi:DNA repair protein RecO (recombination protein O)